MIPATASVGGTRARGEVAALETLFAARLRIDAFVLAFQS